MTHPSRAPGPWPCVVCTRPVGGGGVARWSSSRPPHSRLLASPGRPPPAGTGPGWRLNGTITGSLYIRNVGQVLPELPLLTGEKVGMTLPLYRKPLG